MNKKPGRSFMAWKACCIVGLLILTGCRGVMPEHLIGTWVSNDHRYAGRSLKITSDTVTFASSERNEVTGTIRKVKALRQDTLWMVKISYVDKENTPSTIELVYSGERGESLWLRNQPKVVWKKMDR